MWAPLLMVVATKTTRRPAATISYWLEPLQPQLRRQVGVEVHESTSAPVKHPSAMTVAADARWITQCITA
jgi:hypothetical protein